MNILINKYTFLITSMFSVFLSCSPKDSDQNKEILALLVLPKLSTSSSSSEGVCNGYSIYEINNGPVNFRPTTGIIYMNVTAKIGSVLTINSTTTSLNSGSGYIFNMFHFNKRITCPVSGTPSSSTIYNEVRTANRVTLTFTVAGTYGLQLFTATNSLESVTDLNSTFVE